MIRFVLDDRDWKPEPDRSVAERVEEIYRRRTPSSGPAATSDPVRFHAADIVAHGNYPDAARSNR
jgi:hypothetical protein